MAGLGERGTRLRGIASELKEPPEVLTYYHVPPRTAGYGPGWYMGPSFKELTYIGHSAAAAEVWLLDQLRKEEKAGAAK